MLTNTRPFSQFTRDQIQGRGRGGGGAYPNSSKKVLETNRSTLLEANES